MKYYKAQEKQQLFHFASADEVLYGGAAGGGKSFAIIWDAVIFCMKYNEVSVSVFRRTYPELEKSIILEALRSIPRSWYEYNKKEHRMYFHKTESILEFNYCLFESDVFNFQSAQYDRVYFDELTHFTKFQYLYLMSRCRTTKTDIKTQIKSASNPGNIGHAWVKQRFITDAAANDITERVDPESGVKYTTQFIPARLQDNKYLVENDPNYIRNLQRLGKEDMRMLLEGDWDVLKGQFFDEWRYDKHVIKPFEIPAWWTKVRGLDWGYTNPAACVWIAFSPEGDAYLYRELMVTKMSDTELAEKILKMTGNEKINYTMADPSMWSVTQYERGESIAYRMIGAGLNLVKGDNNRVGGWSAIRSYLDWNEKKEPKFHVFETCYDFIESLPGLIHDESNPESVNTLGNDHLADATRYAIMSKPLIPKKPKTGIPQFSFEYWLQRKENLDRQKGYVGTL